MKKNYKVTVIHTLREAIILMVQGHNELDAEATALEIAQGGDKEFEDCGDDWKIGDVVLSESEQDTE
jgi:hypothetical protein